MRKIIHFSASLLLLAWELPQVIAGLLVFAFLKIQGQVVNTGVEHKRLFVETLHTGVSLGWLIFWTPAGNRYSTMVNDCRMHEYGHARQSAMLGPLYLFVVGIPSVLRVLYRKFYFLTYRRQWTRYYDGFPEKWADRLGGVKP